MSLLFYLFFHSCQSPVNHSYRWICRFAYRVATTCRRVNGVGAAKVLRAKVRKLEKKLRANHKVNQRQIKNRNKIKTPGKTIPRMGTESQAKTNRMASRTARANRLTERKKATSRATAKKENREASLRRMTQLPTKTTSRNLKNEIRWPVRSLLRRTKMGPNGASLIKLRINRINSNNRINKYLQWRFNGIFQLDCSGWLC